MVRLPLVIWIIPDHWQVSKNFTDRASEDRGCLATFDGDKWEVIERRQYTEVIGPQGIYPTIEGSDDPLWAIGWDKHSLRLQVMEHGKFHLFLLPKGCLNNDAAHGWFTEWPRIGMSGKKICLWICMACSLNFPAIFLLQIVEESNQLDPIFVTFPIFAFGMERLCWQLTRQVFKETLWSVRHSPIYGLVILMN